MDGLRGRLDDLPGQSFEGLTVTAADDFAYTDPVDGSTATGQGIRIISGDAARAVFRLSGTSTEDATLRVYLERFEPDPARQAKEPQAALAAARGIAGITKHTGRTAPDVIT